jgi:hypothetical protein
MKSSTSLVVDGVPQPVALTVHRDGHLVEMLMLTRARTNYPQVLCDRAIKIDEPAVARLVRYINAALCQ